MEVPAIPREPGAIRPLLSHLVGLANDLKICIRFSPESQHLGAGYQHQSQQEADPTGPPPSAACGRAGARCSCRIHGVHLTRRDHGSHLGGKLARVFTPSRTRRPPKTPTEHRWWALPATPGSRAPAVAPTLIRGSLTHRQKSRARFGSAAPRHLPDEPAAVATSRDRRSTLLESVASGWNAHCPADNGCTEGHRSELVGPSNTRRDNTALSVSRIGRSNSQT
jgi:hypothetical protein